MTPADTAAAPSPQPLDTAAIRATQRARARVTAWLLAGFVVLIFAISIVKIAAGYG